MQSYDTTKAFTANAFGSSRGDIYWGRRLFNLVVNRSIVGEPNRSRTAWTTSMCSVHSVETNLFDLERASASMLCFPGMCRGSRTMFSRRQNWRSSHVILQRAGECRGTFLSSKVRHYCGVVWKQGTLFGSLGGSESVLLLAGLPWVPRCWWTSWTPPETTCPSWLSRPRSHGLPNRNWTRLYEHGKFGGRGGCNSTPGLRQDSEPQKLQTSRSKDSGRGTSRSRGTWCGLNLESKRSWRGRRYNLPCGIWSAAEFNRPKRLKNSLAWQNFRALSCLTLDSILTILSGGGNIHTGAEANPNEYEVLGGSQFWLLLVHNPSDQFDLMSNVICDFRMSLEVLRRSQSST
jgi:hypothetical protein